VEKTKIARPVPAQGAYVADQPFWDGARAGRLVLQYCPATNAFQHYPRPVSLATGSRRLEWRPVSGNGTIYAFTTLRVAGPGTADRVPLLIATVELDEGVRILANILEATAHEVRIGLRVCVAWDRLADDVPYPAFRPSSTHENGGIRVAGEPPRSR
jgi:uncharacterized OB-fold protein